jgi:hypothetical protein
MAFFCGHPRWEATWNDGIVECWPALAQFGVNRFFWYNSLDYNQKWIHYEFGLGQGILGMKSGKRSILKK